MPLHAGQARPHTGRAMPDAPRARPQDEVGDDAADEALMLAYGAGNAGAFDRLYARHRGGVYRYLVRHVGNAGIADELFQDVWMNAIKAGCRALLQRAPTVSVLLHWQHIAEAQKQGWKPGDFQ